MTDQPKSDTGQAMLSSDAGALLERVVIGGDLSHLKPAERVLYYAAVCQSVGLNPLTKPFEYLYLQNKMTLYARKEATEQLRVLHGVSVMKLEHALHKMDTEDLYVVTAYACDAKGRTDAATGAVTLSGLHGEQRANAMMKAEMKAKRRVTLSLCGLGLLDKSEIEIPAGAQRVTEVVTVAGELSEVERVEGMAPGEPPRHHEVQTLFPTPEADRAGLIQRAKIGAARMNKAKVGEIKAEVFGSAEAKYEDVDLAALVAFVQRVEVPL